MSSVLAYCTEAKYHAQTLKRLFKDDTIKKLFLLFFSSSSFTVYGD